LIVEEHDGLVPSDVAALEALPGVGPYTARAVAAIAFGVPVGALDTNVRRVLGRVVLGDAAAVGGPELQRLADSSVPRDRAADWTHAVMDVGATICRPQRPGCEGCPVQAWCRYAASGATGLPPASRRPRRREPAFPSTSRWLRGRILDKLRAAPDGVWVELEGPMSVHDADAVVAAAAAMSTEGLIELDVSHPPAFHARLPVA
jgi:A/G-specific adenine glycosylase